MKTANKKYKFEWSEDGTTVRAVESKDGKYTIYTPPSLKNRALIKVALFLLSFVDVDRLPKGYSTDCVNSKSIVNIEFSKRIKE